ncbi:MAG: hypothetical protein HN855_08560 [Anaerolineae bacterium]|jgi:hypothetical protein|nr:hypothetical protein [Anaerolineae bacterium]MBT7071669.1 hypothetical protein [Anaerolineae bacterium]MBT7325195.1 hypothetical protein [Anaerolineae bacterium]
MKTLLLTLLGIALTIISFENPMLFIFPMWIFVALFKAPLTRLFQRFPRNWGFVVAGVLFGMLTEIFAIINNLDVPPAERILLHPEPIPDLIYGLLYYSFLIFTWYFLLRKINFSAKEIFILTGIFGIFVEETGQVFLRIFSQPVTGALYAIIVAFVYGIFPMLAYLLTKESFPAERKKGRMRYYLLVALALFVQYAIYGNFVYNTIEKYF